MELITKIKLLLLIIVSVGSLVMLYFWLDKRKNRTNLKAQAQFKIPTDKVRKVVLDNGMTVLVFKKESNPKVLVQIAYNVGSSVEESGERGLAHLLEHMIFKGTEKLSEGDIDAIARKYGANFNAFTSNDMTSYYFETNKNNWKPFVQILADCMQNTRFDEQHLASEIKAVIQELKMLKDNYWRLMLLKACELVFPPNHPYHTPVIGYKEDLLSLSAENLKKFYQKYYQPERATLFIVGDVDIDEAINLAREQFEHIPNKKTPERTQELPMLMQELVTNRTRQYEDVARDMIGFYWSIPGAKSSDEILSSAIADLLGRGEGSRLYRVLVDEKKYATAVYVSPLKFMDAGIFLIYIEPVEGKSAQCREVVEYEITTMIKKGVTHAELTRMNKYQSRTFFEKMESLEDFTDSWIRSFFATGDELEIFKRVEKYSKITSEQVQSFMQHHLDPFLMNQIELVPLPEDKKELRIKLKKMSDTIDQKILSRYVRTAPVEAVRFVHQIAEPEPLEFVFPKTDKVIELENGLKIFVKQRDNAPLISVNISFKDGTYFDTAQEGIAVDLMMNMLMEGSKEYSKKELVDFFESYGASYEFDHNGARLEMLSQDFETLTTRLIKILRTPLFEQDTCEKTKTIFVHNFERSKDSAQAVAMRLLFSTVYKHHTFSWSFDDAITQVQRITVQDLVDLHKKHMVAENLVVSIVGDFDLDQMETLATKIFSELPAGSRFVYDLRGGMFTPQEHIDHLMLRDQVILILGQPSSVDIYNPDLVPLKLLNTICFYSLGSRLYQLREQSGLFYSAFGRFAGKAAKIHGIDYVGAVLSPDKVAVAEEQIRAMVKHVSEHGVTEQEMKSARQLYLKDLIDAVSDNRAVAHMFCYLEEMELSQDYYDNVLERIQTMELADLNTIAKCYAHTHDMARVRVGRIEGK